MHQKCLSLFDVFRHPSQHLLKILVALVVCNRTRQGGGGVQLMWFYPIEKHI